MALTVGISTALHARLIGEAAASPAAEVCGLLFGSAGWIDAALACANVASDPATSFEIDPAALIAAHRAARAGGPTVIGHYHSHPVGAASPSARDAAAAAGDGEFWLIIGAGTMRVWRSTGQGVFDPVKLRIGDNLRR